MKDSVLKLPRQKYSPPVSVTEGTEHGTGNVIDGHDYTHAEFVEIDPKYKDSILKPLRKVHGTSLLVLTVPRKGPGGTYRGIGWMDLFAERTVWDKLIWPPMEMICDMALDYAMNEDCMFRVWFCPPGLLHVEVDDDGTWSVQDILTLPPWMLMG